MNHQRRYVSPCKERGYNMLSVLKRTFSWKKITSLSIVKIALGQLDEEAHLYRMVNQSMIPKQFF